MNRNVTATAAPMYSHRAQVKRQRPRVRLTRPKQTGEDDEGDDGSNQAGERTSSRRGLSSEARGDRQRAQGEPRVHEMQRLTRMPATGQETETAGGGYANGQEEDPLDPGRSDSRGRPAPYPPARFRPGKQDDDDARDREPGMKLRDDGRPLETVSRRR